MASLLKFLVPFTLTVTQSASAWRYSKWTMFWQLARYGRSVCEFFPFFWQGENIWQVIWHVGNTQRSIEIIYSCSVVNITILASFPPLRHAYSSLLHHASGAKMWSGSPLLRVNLKSFDILYITAPNDQPSGVMKGMVECLEWSIKKEGGGPLTMFKSTRATPVGVLATVWPWTPTGRIINSSSKTNYLGVNLVVSQSRPRGRWALWCGSCTGYSRVWYFRAQYPFHAGIVKQQWFVRNQNDLVLLHFYTSIVSQRTVGNGHKYLNPLSRFPTLRMHKVDDVGLFMTVRKHRKPLRKLRLTWQRQAINSTSILAVSLRSFSLPSST